MVYKQCSTAAVSAVIGLKPNGTLFSTREQTGQLKLKLFFSNIEVKVELEILYVQVML